MVKKKKKSVCQHYCDWSPLFKRGSGEHDDFITFSNRQPASDIQKEEDISHFLILIWCVQLQIWADDTLEIVTFFSCLHSTQCPNFYGN